MKGNPMTNPQREEELSQFFRGQELSLREHFRNLEAEKARKERIRNHRVTLFSHLAPLGMDATTELIKIAAKEDHWEVYVCWIDGDTGDGKICEVKRDVFPPDLLNKWLDFAHYNKEIQS